MSGARVTIGRGAALMMAAALVVATAAATYVIARRQHARELPAAGMAPSAPAAAPSDNAAPPAAAVDPGIEIPLPDLQVPVTDEAIARAGIEVAPVTTSGAGGAVKIPAVLEANAYRRVIVTSLVAGRVTRVQAELGQSVRRGASLALVYSPALAEAQTAYLSRRAELNAAAQELARTERLAAIGAASQQELERIRATHTSVATAVEGARAQLVLLGMRPAAITELTQPNEITATTGIAAPIDGVVTERHANVGLNVDPSMPLFTIVDLSTVWAIGDLYEQDFPRVRVGSEATITTTAYPGLALGGRVTYIDPQLNAESRTARVRVEVPNPRRELRLGMYAELQFGAREGPAVVTVPREAVQAVGNRHFVYLVPRDQRGYFIEREVRLGDASGATVQITSGARAGDAVVTKGSFFVRAERERLGLRPPPRQQPTRDARVMITDKGFEPDRLTISSAGPVLVTFVRTTDNTCAKDVAVPSQNIKRALPLNQPVVIELTQTRGEIAFTCGMNMLRGAIVVQ